MRTTARPSPAPARPARPARPRSPAPGAVVALAELGDAEREGLRRFDPCLAALLAQADACGPAANAPGSGSAAASEPAASADWLRSGPLPALDDAEGARLPLELPPVVDAHVHLFPDPVFEAIWRWFDRYGWAIRYKLRTPEVLRFLFERGVSRVVALHYSHKPGMARALNAYMAEVAAAEPRVLGLATVLPGEPGAGDILREAFAAGLGGVKLHCHVQCFAADAPELDEIAAACVEADRPLVMHAGREPASPEYKCDARALSGAGRVENLLRAHPALRLVVPHLGADEIDEFAALTERHENLWLDTTMVVGRYFPLDEAAVARALRVRPDRVLYGTDFPNLPYAWDREVKALAAAGLGDEHLAALLAGNANGLFQKDERGDGKVGPREGE